MCNTLHYHIANCFIKRINPNNRGLFTETPLHLGAILCFRKLLSQFCILSISFQKAKQLIGMLEALRSYSTDHSVMEGLIKLPPPRRVLGFACLCSLNAPLLEF